MKKLLFSTFVLVAAVAPQAAMGAAAQEYYINSGRVDYSAGDPLIDAKNFINRGYFSATASYNMPFYTWNTLNFTNYGTMRASPGFGLNLMDSGMAQPFNPKRAENFVNAGLVDQSTATVYGASKIVIDATNVINRGLMAVSSSGLLTISGENVDFARSTVSAGGGGQGFDQLQGLHETLWAINTNDMDAVFTSEKVTTATITNATQFFNDVSFAVGPYKFTVGADNTTFEAYVNQTAGANTDFAVDVLILGDDSVNVSHRVAFERTDRPSAKIVEWQGVVTNRVTGEVLTNSLYLRDSFALTSEHDYADGGEGTNAFGAPVPRRPANYTLSTSAPEFDALNVMTSTPVNPALFMGTNIVFVTNAMYGFNLRAEPVSVDPLVAHQTYSNVAGRIEIKADKVLDLTRSRLEGMSFLRLECTNHFVGSTNARITSPFSSFNLATTNGSMSIANLITPTVPSIVGDVEVWSGTWTNASESGSTLYNVTIVRSALRPEAASYVDELSLRSPNIEIADVISVINDLRIDAERLTITSSSNSPAEMGELNLLKNQTVWSPLFPRLKYLTNNGIFLTANAAYLGTASNPPWFSGGFDAPYEAIVNTGDIQTQGFESWSRHFESSGFVLADTGPLTVRADFADISGGLLFAGEDITLTADTIQMTNSQVYLSAARRIILNPSRQLSDGSLENGSANPILTNYFFAGGGISLLSRPVGASLLWTEVYLTAYPNMVVENVWAGEDQSCVSTGFFNNAALGVLALDGGAESVFAFGGPTGSNALYVKVLNLTSQSALFDPSTNYLLGVSIHPGMKIYYNQAFAGSNDISSLLNGKNEGRFCHIADFAGTPPWTPPVVETQPGGGGASGDGTPPVALLPVVDRPGSLTTNLGVIAPVGVYQGLFHSPTQVVAASSGFFKVAINARGGYSGIIKSRGKTFPFSGRMSGDEATTFVKPLGLSLSFELDDESGTIEGAITNDTWASTLTADRVMTLARGQKSPFAGRYTVVLPAAEGVGCGFGAALVTPSGILVYGGTLGDGAKVSQTVSVNGEGIWPLYMSLNKGEGVAMSWVQFRSAPVGKMLWVYPGGFRQLDLESSKYTKRSDRAIELFSAADGGHGRLCFEEGQLDSVRAVVIIGGNNRAAFPSGEKITLQINPATGLFNGLFRNAETGKPVTFKGALLQEQNYGAGLFMNGTVPGRVYLTPPAGN
jgi:hypothetical protein